MKLNFSELDEIIFANHFSSVCLFTKEKGKVAVRGIGFD